MLKHLNPILSPNQLQVLRQMGHGVEIAIVDANFPAYSQGIRVVRLDGVDAVQALDAVLSVMPLDEFTPHACWRMQVVGSADEELPIFAEFRDVISKREAPKFALASLERYEFYGRASKCFAIISTSERRLYGNIILKMGVVRPQ